MVGMIAGATMAALGLMGRGLMDGGPARFAALSGDTLASGEVVAVVGDETISRATLETALALVERDRSRPATTQERARILERLIDEELLFQRGMALGLARSDRKLRADLVSTVVSAATAEADVSEPSDEELSALFDANPPLFTGPSALRVAQVFVATRQGTRAGVAGGSPDAGTAPSGSATPSGTVTSHDEIAAERARQAAARLRSGEDIADVRRELGDPPSLEIPSSLQPASRLRDYIGPSAASVAQGLKVGEVSDPEEGPDGYRVLLILERDDPGSVTWENKRPEVLAEFQRRSGERAMRRELERLREQTKVIVVGESGEASR